VQQASGRRRAKRAAVGVAVAAVISLSAGASAGLAQYGESPPAAGGTTGVAGVTGTGSEQQTLLAKCIAKAQTKFGDNRPKKKAAIRKCHKKYR
jgi:hypothetical protein